jgi:hypothetical protein
MRSKQNTKQSQRGREIVPGRENEVRGKVEEDWAALVVKG